MLLPLAMLATLAVANLNQHDDRAAGDIVTAATYFQATSIDTVTLELTWKAGAGQNIYGNPTVGWVPADRTELRYSLSAITNVDEWSTMTEAAAELPVPAAMNSPQGCIVRDLHQGTAYWFVLRTFYKGAWNDSAILAVTTGTDGVAPASIVDLLVTFVGAQGVDLAWTASGDDGATGIADHFSLRYSTAGEITSNAAFNAATPMPLVPAPLAAGTEQSATVESLAAGLTYWFAIRAVDEVGNVSALSTTSPSAALPIPPAGSGAGGNASPCGASSSAAGLQLLAALLLPALLRRSRAIP